jgi:hypothetical protein
MRKTLLIGAAVAALAFAAAAGAVGLKVLSMSIGDTLKVKGTKVVCGMSRNSTIGSALTCFKTGGGGTLVGSYAVQIGDRYAALMRVTSKNGNTKPVLIKKQK